jgi:hypothetical protein
MSDISGQAIAPLPPSSTTYGSSISKVRKVKKRDYGDSSDASTFDNVTGFHRREDEEESAAKLMKALAEAEAAKDVLIKGKLSELEEIEVKLNSFKDQDSAFVKLLTKRRAMLVSTIECLMESDLPVMPIETPSLPITVTSAI